MSRLNRLFSNDSACNEVTVSSRRGVLCDESAQSSVAMSDIPVVFSQVFNYHDHGLLTENSRGVAAVAPLDAQLAAIRVMCSGQVSPEVIMRAFRAGVDGVLVLGCHDGDCHYISSGHRVAKRIPLVRDLVDYVSIDPGRLRLDRGDGDASRALEVTRQFVEELRALGPIGA